MSQAMPSDHLVTNNFILKSLPPEDIARLLPHLELVDMGHGTIPFDVDEVIEYVYFPNFSMISVVSSTFSGQTAEAGVIGWEGIAGIEALLGDSTSLNLHIVQLPGDAWRAKADVMKEEFARAGAFQKAALAFTRGMMAQMGQTALCNRLHVAEKRLAKWLLMCHDRSATDVLPITQEFAALMLGSNRVSVTQAARHLQDLGLLEYKRGVITILKRDELETFSCECYEKISAEYARFTG